jgi:hypothetical protein
MVSAMQYGCNPYGRSTYVLTSIASVMGMGVDQYFQQSILGIMVIVSVVLTFDRSKPPVIK